MTTTGFDTASGTGTGIRRAATSAQWPGPVPHTSEPVHTSGHAVPAPVPPPPAGTAGPVSAAAPIPVTGAPPDAPVPLARGPGPAAIPPPTGPVPATGDHAAGTALLGVASAPLGLIPVTLRAAAAFVADHPRHLAPPRGHRFGAAAGEHLVGVVIVGRPVARTLDDGITTEVTYLCTTGYPNTCSLLLGAAWRAARALGSRPHRMAYPVPAPDGHGRRTRRPVLRLVTPDGGDGQTSATTPPSNGTPSPVSRSSRIWHKPNVLSPSCDCCIRSSSGAGNGAGRCAFASAPDVVADAAATRARSAPMLDRIRAVGYLPALIAQDGLEDLTAPWADFDVLFLGSTGWKLGPAAADLTAEALKRGKSVYMGGANSLRRLRYAQAIGCHFVDGMHLVYGPDRRLPELLGWLRILTEPTPAPSSGRDLS